MQHLYEASWSSRPFDEIVTDLISMHVVCADPNMLINSIVKSWEGTELRRETRHNDSWFKVEIEIPVFPASGSARIRVLIVSLVDYITNESEII